nr:putative reverse transcriptase, RNA-dependent DNA polymerase [Tanacetum cinerariifolium]
MHKAFPLPVTDSHCQRRKMPLLEEKRSDCKKDHTAINDKKKLPVKDGSYAKSPKTQFRSVFGISQGFSFYYSLRLLRVKGIKREFSNARTPQQNGVAEGRNRTLIEASKTMLADAKLPITFWAEAVNTACYVQNRAHDALLEFSSSKPQDHCSSEVLEGSGNTNPTAFTPNLPADHMETLIVETPIPTTLVDCPKGVRPIGTKWVLKNKKDERGTVIRNKARLVAQGHTQEEGIDYDEVFAPVSRIEAIRLFLAYASFMGFTLCQMDVKSAFLYGIIDEEVLLEPGMVLGLNTCRRMVFKGDGTGKDVDLHLYRSMIGSLMYLTASRPDIMFDVCAYARHQVIPKECHLHAFKRFFRYLKGHPKLGLWYPKDSPFDLVAYSDSDYGGATQDHKSTTRGCQFLGRRLISWQCKKQTIVATSTTEAEYVAASSCCRQVLWIQNQLLDYGDSFENKLINVDHIHTDENVADLLTKPFDAGRFQYLVCKLFPLLGKLSTASVNFCRLSMPCETLSREISTSILRFLHTAKTFDLVWIWLGGDYGNVFLNGF